MFVKTIHAWLRPPDVVHTPEVVKAKSGKPLVLFNASDGEERTKLQFTDFEARIRAAIVGDLNKARKEDAHARPA